MGPMVGGGANMTPVDFKQKVITNVEYVINRVSEIAPQYFSEEVNPYQPLERDVLYYVISLVQYDFFFLNGDIILIFVQCV